MLFDVPQAGACGVHSYIMLIHPALHEISYLILARMQFFYESPLLNIGASQQE